MYEELIAKLNRPCNYIVQNPGDRWAKVDIYDIQEAVKVLQSLTDENASLIEKHVKDTELVTNEMEKFKHQYYSVAADNATLRAQLDAAKEQMCHAANSNDHAERRTALKILRSIWPEWPLPSAPEQEETGK